VPDPLLEPHSPTFTTFPVRPYASDGGFRVGGMVALMIGLAVAGATLGVVTHFVAKAFYLILIFPVGIGCVLGGVGLYLIKRGHIRDPMLAAFAGLLGGIFAMFVMHYASYYEFRRDVTPEIPAKVMALSDEDLASMHPDTKDGEESLAVIRAARGFPAFMALRAHQGVEVSHNGGTPLNIGYIGSLIYWLVEIAIVAGLALAIMNESAREPYCVPCESWKKAAPLGTGRGDKSLAKSGVESGDPAQVAAGVASRERADTYVLSRSVCPACAGERSSIDVKLVEVIPQKKGAPKTKTIAHASWPREALPVLERAVQTTRRA